MSMRSLSIALALLSAAFATSQVRPVYSSIESDAASARLICVGKIAKVEDVTIEGYRVAELTVEVSQTLKGPRQKTIKAHRSGNFGYDKKPYYEAASKAGVEFVWFVFADTTGRVEYNLDLASSPYRTLGGLAIGMDYTMLRTRQEVIDRVREFLRENPESKDAESLLTPLPGTGGFVDFIVPICPWAEKLAVRMITKPESFGFDPPRGNPSGPDSEQRWAKAKEGMLRTEGLILLRHFESESNIRLAKRYLADENLAIRHRYGQPTMTHFWVRDAAYRLLRLWDVAVEPPVVVGPAISEIDGYPSVDGSRIEYMLRRPRS